MTEQNKICNAWICQSLKQDCKVTTEKLENTMAIQYNDIKTNANEVFDFDDKTGILTLKKLGNYSLRSTSMFSNIGSQDALIGISVTRNGALISNSQHFTLCKAGNNIHLQHNIAFNANVNDVILVVVEFTNSTFKIPNSPIKSGFNSNLLIASGDWAPNSYNIIYNGEIGCDCDIN